jgi:hypothetical protein
LNLLFGLLLLVQAATPLPQPSKPTVDRNAFTFTEYRLLATLDPAKHGIAVQGDITLRNDSDKPQEVAALQISSSLEWKSITIENTPAKHTDEKVNSDIDHTGAVNEAQVTISPVAANESVTLHVRYAGTVELGSARLRRLGTPQNIAEQNDWDRIGSDITALRGVGYVQWYPVSIEPALLSDGNTAFERIARWKGRHQQSRMTLTLRGATGTIVSSGDEQANDGSMITWRSFGMYTPTLVMAPYQKTTTPNGDVFFLQGSSGNAQRYAKVFGELEPLPEARPRVPQRVAQLPAAFSAFEAKDLLATPFSDRATDAVLKFNLLHTAAHAYLYSDRAWLNEGFAHWVQLRSVNSTSGRKAALEMLRQRESGLALADSAEGRDLQPLTTAYDEIFYRTKSTFVWWMLADVVGEDKLLAAVRAYIPAQDHEPSYFQRLLEKESGKDLEQFFDEWVYRDKGLPDFKISEVYPRQNLNGGYMLTVTVENTGNAGAEVPIIARAKNVENSARVWVPANGKATARIILPLLPTEVMVNDGSVPEIDPTDNVYTMAPKPQPSK